MYDSDRLLHLIELLYAAPGSHAGWQRFMLGLCTVVDGTAASFISHNLPNGSGSVAVTVGTDECALAAYMSQWIHQDPWARSPAARNLQAGAIVLGHHIVSRAALKRTTFYNEFSRRLDIGQSIVSVVESGPRRLSGFSINGSDRRAEFDARDVGLLTALMPHMQQALALHRRLSDIDGERHYGAEALNAVGHAVFQTDGHGLIRHVNGAGGILLRNRDGISVDRGALRAATPADTARLRHLIGSAAATAGGVGIEHGGRLLVGRPSGRRPLRVLVAPATGSQDPFGAREPRALVFIADPDRHPLPSEIEVRALFGLTAAEARLARALADGLTLTEAARQFEQSPATLRTRLKAVFDKTDTHRQSELVQLIREWPPR